MPPIAWPKATLTQPSGDHRPELQHPTPHRVIGEVEPALGEQILHVSVAQGEAEIEPNRVLDDLGREPMAAVAERADILPPLTPPRFRDNAAGGTVDREIARC